jgi:transcriptional regulator with XRE-family HTH domain
LEAEEAFGHVLKELRKRQNLSQEKLAQEAEMERNYISLLERGLNSVSLKKIFHLAQALKVTVGEFMTMVEAKSREPPTHKARNKG